MNIPDTILKKARIANRMTEEEFATYLEQLQEEGRTYCLNFFTTEDVEESLLKLCTEHYVQYTIFSKIEYEEVSRDKLDTLHSIIVAYNKNYESKIPKLAKGVKFL